MGLGYYVAEDNLTWEEDEHTIFVVKWFEVGLDANFPELRLLITIWIEIRQEVRLNLADITPRPVYHSLETI